MRRPHRVLAPLCTAALVALAACGGSTSGGDQASASISFSPSPSGALSVSGFDTSDAAARSRSEVATQKVAPVHVSFDTVGFDLQRFSTQVASGQAPDLVVVDRSMIDTLADQKLIVPLDACYKLYDVDPFERFYPAAVKDVTYDDQVYGVPQFLEPSLIIGNTPVMTQDAVTMDQLDTSKPDQVLVAADRMARSSGGRLSVLGFDPDLPSSTALWMAVFGGRLNDGSGKPTLDNANNVKALTFMKELLDAQGGYGQVTALRDSFNRTDPADQFTKNEVGAQTSPQHDIARLANTTSKLSLEATTIKTLDGRALGLSEGSAFAIPTSARNKDAACAWSLQATSPEAWDAAAASQQAVAARTKDPFTGLFTASPIADQEIRAKYVKPSGNAQLDNLVAASYDALTNPFSFGGSPVRQEITQQLGTATQQALTGAKSPDAALKDAQAAALTAWQQSNAGKQK